MSRKYAVWFWEVDKEDVALVGGKGANLGEMIRAGFPVPAGFIITAKAYYQFLEVNRLKGRIKQILDQLNYDDPKNLFSASEKIKKIILTAQIPKEIAKIIVDYYLKLPTFKDAKNQNKNFIHSLKGVFSDIFVAVRSSATAEDLPQASFAGQQETFLNVKGENNLLDKVRACWASLFTPRAIFYRRENKFDHFKVGIAVAVQKMLNPETSGVMFTVDPLSGDKKRIAIEAIFGLGELIVQGIVSPDYYLVDKYKGEIVSKYISTQEKMLVRDKSKNQLLRVPLKRQKTQKLSNKQILQLSILGKKLERHYFFPQDIEWAIEDNQIYIVQTRPITTIGKREKAKVEVLAEKPYLTGFAASPGVVVGPVRIILSAKEIHKIKSGEILVASQTNPDFVPAMRKAGAVVTEKGGRTSHAAIVSRELGIPAIVGVSEALTKLKNGLVVTVNGQTGKIYKGNLIKPEIKQRKLTTPLHLPEVPSSFEIPKTATKVYLNLAEPQKAAEYAKLPVDGVGLLRAEFMIAEIGIHPKKLIKEKKGKLFVEKLSFGIETICKAFSPRPVVYRTTDFKTNEYRNLKGGRQFEPEEPNPMLGFRGAFRYISSAEVFELELAAIRQVRNKKGYKNLSLMIPFVRTVGELIKVKKIMAASNLMRSPSFKLWLMIEIPSNVILLDKFIDCGIDGVSIGSNDLTMLILGCDRDNTEVAPLFNEQDEAVLWALEKVIKTCHKRKITSSICGQAPSDYPELVDKLVGWGVTSVSINPDAAVNTRYNIYEAEKKAISKEQRSK